MDYGTGFFTKLSKIEIDNLSRRISGLSDKHQREVLIQAKELFEERNRRFEEEKALMKREFGMDEVLGCNDAMFQLDNEFSPLELLANISDEERYRLMSSRLGTFKMFICEMMNDSIVDPDIVQSLYGIKFIRSDNRRLSKQRRKLLQEARSGSSVDYEQAGVMKLEFKK